jgi:hypothetical protein
VLAGEDVKAIEELSRFPSAKEFLKSNRELRQKLSQRAEPAKLPDNATPEQVAEYRKAQGVPDVAADATPDKYMEAYGVKIPDGVQLGEVEKGMLGDFAKTMHAAHMPPAAVKQAADFWFKAQAANEQAIRNIDLQRDKEWVAQAREQLGKDYDGLVAGANDYLTQLVPDDTVRSELLNARLPGGGLISAHPAFIQIMTTAAAQNGFTDRIESASLESGGKSLEQQQMEIEALRRTDVKLYNTPAVQEKLDKLIELRLKRGEIDELGNPTRRRAS